MKKRLTLGGIAAACMALALGLVVFQPADANYQAASAGLPNGFKHLVVIYEENHSFDNLYGNWGTVNGQQVDGSHTAAPQKAQDGTVLSCLPQNDVNILAKGASAKDACASDSSQFANKTFKINDYIDPSAATCAKDGAISYGTPNQSHGVSPSDANAVPGGCTEDIVHRFYQEQYQIDGGKQDRYVSGSDAVGLTMGYYDTKQLPIYKYLHSKGAPNYVLADHFFQAAFGGSFLNHQFLVAARAPLDTDPTYGGTAAANANPAADGTAANYPLQTTTGTDGQLTKKCAAPESNNRAEACGNFAVNTIQPAVAPHATGAQLPLIDDADYPNIGDRLSDAKVSWNWYSGGWNDAEAGHPGAAFQYHHQPLNYFANYAPGKPGRAHLKDETDFYAGLKSGNLPAVSFVKPYGTDNEHPGYASETTGSDHLVDLISSIENSKAGKDTLIVVTYDEFGGQEDHVAPPSDTSSTKGAHDAWGPGTRIPALVIGKGIQRSGVDHTVYDTTSILSLIEHSYGLKPLSTRDAAVNNLGHAVGSK